MPSPRSGYYVRQPSGYEAFVPGQFPPHPPIEMTREIVAALSRAATALGRLDGSASVLPNPDLFVRSFVHKEALLSSQIEGTQATLEDVFAPTAPPERQADVNEVVNYVSALKHGTEAVRRLPVSLRLVREIHAVLLKGARGGEKTPGEFRKSQNWIGQERDLRKATFVPPPPQEMLDALHAWEKYMVTEPHGPELIKCALLHAQFETIHPFLDGNGRIGRLLITFLLQQWGLLRRPLLYLSLWFKQHRDEYYAKLQAARDAGAWEPWVEFFLAGIAETSDGAVAAATAILELREKDIERVLSLGRSRNAAILLDALFQRPVVDVATVQSRLKVSQPTANGLVGRFVEIGILREVTGRSWRRVFRYEAYLKILRKDP